MTGKVIFNKFLFVLISTIVFGALSCGEDSGGDESGGLSPAGLWEATLAEMGQEDEVQFWRLDTNEAESVFVMNGICTESSGSGVITGKTLSGTWVNEIKDFFSFSVLFAGNSMSGSWSKSGGEGGILILRRLSQPSCP